MNGKDCHASCESEGMLHTQKAAIESRLLPTLLSDDLY